MVHKTKVMNELNDEFIRLIESNIEDSRQSVIYLSNNNSITLNHRSAKIKHYDDILEVYRGDELFMVIDINTIIAVVRK